MSVLTMNLRQLYQRRGLWVAYGLLGFMVLASVEGRLDGVEAGEGWFVGLIALAFVVGMCAAVLQMEIMSKPAAYCLPGHRQMVRRFIFTIGVATNLASSLLFLWYPGLPLALAPLVCCSAFFAGLVFYLGGAALALRRKGGLACAGVIFLMVGGGVLLKLRILLEGVVVGHPVGVIGFGLLGAIGAWVLLGEAELARRHCLGPWVGFGAIFNRERLRRSPQARDGARWARLKDHPRPWVESFFVGRMSQDGSFGMVRCVWGALYRSYGLVISQWRYAAVVALVLAILLGYVGPHLWTVPIFIPIIVLGAYAFEPPVYSTLLTAGGREERFGSTLATVAVGAGLLALFIAGVSLASVLLGFVLPDIDYHGLVVSYRGIGVEALYAALMFVPLASLVQVVLFRRPVLMVVVLVVLLQATATVRMLWLDESAGLLRLIWQDGLAPAGRTGAVGLGVALCWLALAVVLRHIARKWCLVR